jgi:CIC family chloride channel protein
MVEAILATRQDVLCISFNCWLSPASEEAGTALVESIAVGLANKLVREAEMAETAQWVQGCIARLKLSKGSCGNAPHGSALPIDGRGLSQEIHELRKAFAALIGEAGIARLVVLVDDLDYCQPKAAAETLEAVRLLAVLDKAVFVIGADAQALENAVGASFPNAPEGGFAKPYSRAYLEKLLQASFRIPPLGAAETEVYVALLLLGAALGERSAAFAKLRALGRSALSRPWDAKALDRADIETALGASIEGRGQIIAMAKEIGPMLAAGTKGNPRQIKRFLNALTLRLRLAAERGYGGAIDPARLAKLMLAEQFLPAGLFAPIVESIANSPKGLCPELALIEARASAGSTSSRTDREPVIADWTRRPEVVRWAAIKPTLGDVPMKPYLFLLEDRNDAPAPAPPRFVETAAQANIDQPAAIADPKDGEGSLLALAVLAPIVGVASGLLGALFRLSLEQADHWRNGLIAWAHGHSLAGFLFLIALCAASVVFAAWLVRKYAPYASGSGIPHVEAVLNGDLPQAPFRLIPVKFLGGLFAIGSGLALGREGPSVQMGASIAHLVGKIFRRGWPDNRVLFAAGAGAGLATAFGAPIAGAIFVLEELVKRFEPRIAIAALGASAAAISTARLLLGGAPDFSVPTLAYAGAETRPLYFALGAIAGLAAILYNRTLLGTIAVAERFSASSLRPRAPVLGALIAALAWLDFALGAAAGLAIGFAALVANWPPSEKRATPEARAGTPVELRAALIGAAVGMLAWFAPDLVGGGDQITQRTLAGTGMIAILPMVFLLRLGLGAASYAAGAPGGLFAPMLVLGAQLGLFFGEACKFAFPNLDIQPEGFAIVGMAALFTGVVRAPLTGIVLVCEMTASVTMLLPMLGACFLAMLIPTLLRDAPIYDSLRELTLRRDKSAGNLVVK